MVYLEFIRTNRNNRIYLLFIQNHFEGQAGRGWKWLGVIRNISSGCFKKFCYEHFQSTFSKISEIFSEILLAIVLELGVEVSDLALHAPAKLVMLEAGPSSISPRPNRIFSS